MVLIWEEHPAVHDQQAVVVLEDRHVATDLAEPAQWDHPQSALREGARSGEFGVDMAHVVVLGVCLDDLRGTQAFT